MGMKLRSMSAAAVALGALLSGCGDRIDNSVAIPIQATSIAGPATTAERGPRAMNFAIEPDTFENRVHRITFYGGQFKVFATGDITEGSAEALRAFIARNKIESAKVVFDSPGGSLVGGLRLGQAIRDLQFDTDIGAQESTYDHPRAAVCASSCAYAFAGGVNRYYGSPNRLGVHQFYGGEGRQGTLEEGQAVSGIIVSYLSKMGVDASAFALTTMAKSNEMLWLTESEAGRLGFANNGTQPTSAEIRLVEGQPYLRMEQTQRDVMSRVLITCLNRQLRIAAGVVTDPETSSVKAESVARSYLEIDHKEAAPMSGPKSVSADGSVLWVSRDLTPEMIRRLVIASDLDVWTENGSAFRWGAQMDVSKVRPQIANFIRNCAP